jgi:hypothetical protein
MFRRQFIHLNVLKLIHFLTIKILQKDDTWRLCCFILEEDERGWEDESKLLVSYKSMKNSAVVAEESYETLLRTRHPPFSAHLVCQVKEYGACFIQCHINYAKIVLFLFLPLDVLSLKAVNKQNRKLLTF